MPNAFRFSSFAAAATLALTSMSLTSAQAPDERHYGRAEATIYRDAAYRGPAVSVAEEKSNLGLSWPVNSIRVARGRWELCERSRFRGQCRTIDRDTPMLNNVLRGMTVQSMRPVRGGGGWNPNPPANDQTVRGNFAEFHTQPGTGGYRVLACTSGSATANCAARTADSWCRSIGWNGSAREHLESVSGRVYLADVLCVRSGY